MKVVSASLRIVDLNRTSSPCRRIVDLEVTASGLGMYNHFTCYRCNCKFTYTRTYWCCRKQMNFEDVALSLNYRPVLFIQ